MPESPIIGGCFHHRLIYELDLRLPVQGRATPYWQGTLYRAHLKPDARAVGISGKIGWHTLRHTFATLLKANGEDTKMVPKLLRHANESQQPQRTAIQRSQLSDL